MLGCDTIGALDVRNQCSGFVYAMSVADAFIKVGQYKNILVVGAEIHSFGLDFTDRGRGVSVILVMEQAPLYYLHQKMTACKEFLQRICTQKESMLMNFVQNSGNKIRMECTFEKRT